MKLEDIDGDVYITESLLDELRVGSVTSKSSPKYTVLVGSTPVGTLKSYKSSPPLFEVEFECSTDPGSLITLVAGERITVAGIDLGADYKIGEVSCNVESLRCTLKAIHIEEVPDERRDPDIRVRQVHGVDREEGADSTTGPEQYP